MNIDQCPACGHQLDDYEDAEISTGERLATTVADHVASWWFAGSLAIVLGAWVIANTMLRPFDDHPIIMLAVISAVLASIAAFQGPLILLTQRRAAMRDRDRDRAALLVGVHAEQDIHRLEQKLDALIARIDSPPPEHPSPPRPSSPQSHDH